MNVNATTAKTGQNSIIGIFIKFQYVYKQKDEFKVLICQLMSNANKQQQLL